MPDPNLPERPAVAAPEEVVAEVAVLEVTLPEDVAEDLVREVESEITVSWLVTVNLLLLARTSETAEIETACRVYVELD